ncbi:MAG: exopolygalacturonase [Clostridia bacterium]|nr:exopolygalacturonase [Clostridia bacterium]
MTKEFFPDGTTPIDDWFYNTRIPNLSELGKPYKITDFGAKNDGNIYTKEIQSAIDTAHANGGGVIIIPKGRFMSGALFFKSRVNLYLEKDAILMGSDDICDYPLCWTRIEGQCRLYFPALVNADRNDGFTLCGKGVIDGNGFKAWRAFWLRWEWNKNLSNLDEQRPRLLFVSNSSNVTIAETTFQNSHFWSTHIYKCDHVKYLNCNILAPHFPVRAPSSDAIDVDVCHDVLIKNCYFNVNDDSVVLKGGKGVNAEMLSENGENQRVLVEDCHYGFCHGVLTCGSESIHNKNIIVRNCHVDETIYLLWFKLRNDTAQHYEFIRIENIGCDSARSFINLNLFGDQSDNGLSSMVNDVTVKDCSCSCDVFYDVTVTEGRTSAQNFTLENLQIKCRESRFDKDLVRNTVAKNIVVNGEIQ